MIVYAVDIDGTLCVEEDSWWEYEEAKPIKEAIEKVNRLFKEGHHIVIHTARFKEDREVTEKWLKKYGVNYHRLVMGKERADIYIDNSAKRMDEI